MAVNTFAGISNLSNATSAGAKTEIVADIQKIINLIPVTGPNSSGYGTTPAVPDFDTISPSAAQQLIYELQAFQNAVTNGA